MWNIELESKNIIFVDSDGPDGLDEISNTDYTYSQLHIQGMTSKELLYHLQMIPKRAELTMLLSKVSLDGYECVEYWDYWYSGKLCGFEVYGDVGDIGSYFRVVLIHELSSWGVQWFDIDLGPGYLPYIYVSIPYMFSSQDVIHCQECILTHGCEHKIRYVEID